MGARWHIQEQLSAHITDLRLQHFSNVLCPQRQSDRLPLLCSTCCASPQLSVLP